MEKSAKNLPPIVAEDEQDLCLWCCVCIDLTSEEQISNMKLSPF